MRGSLSVQGHRAGENIAQVNGFLCKGCGTCAAACQNKAMSLIHFDDRELVAEIIGALI